MNSSKTKRKVTYEDMYCNYRKLFKKNKEVFKVYYELIHLMHLIIQDVTRKRATELKKTKTYISGSPAISHLYILKILHFFIAHYNLMKSGTIMASYAPLRTIYESILKTYLGIIEPKLGDLNYQNEMKNSLSIEEKEELHKKMKSKQFLKTSFIEIKLYSEDTRKSARNFYKEICEFVHPSIKSLACCYELKEETFIDSGKLGIGLTLSAFILIFELHEDYIRKSYKKRFLKLSANYPTLIPEGVPHLIPDKKTKLIKFHIYEELLESISK